MKEPTVVRLEETERVSFGPLSHYQLIIGDDEGTTPVRTGIQTAQPGYAAPVHQHPYVEILHILDGVAEAWIDGREHEAVTRERATRWRSRPTRRTRSAWSATRRCACSARTPRRSGSSTTRTVREATRGDTASSPDRGQHLVGQDA